MDIKELMNEGKATDPIQIGFPRRVRALFGFIALCERRQYANRYILDQIIPLAQKWVDEHPEEVEEFEIWWNHEEKKRRR